MSGNLHELSLENFCGGAAFELFKRELTEVLKNIDDPNTEPSTERTITLKFSLKPDPRKEQCDAKVQAKSSVAPVMGSKGVVFLGNTNGKPTAYSQDINQMDLYIKEEPRLIKVDQEVVDPKTGEIKNVR